MLRSDPLGARHVWGQPTRNDAPGLQKKSGRSGGHRNCGQREGDAVTLEGRRVLLNARKHRGPSVEGRPAMKFEVQKNR